MSWLFGLNKGNVEAPQVPTFEEGENVQSQGGQAQGGQGGQGGASGGAGVGGSLGSGATGYRSEAYSFDSTALERAAKAAKVRSSLIIQSVVSIIDLNSVLGSGEIQVCHPSPRLVQDPGGDKAEGAADENQGIRGAH